MKPKEPGVPEAPTPADDERVPMFGSWSRIYTAVLLCALACMGLIALFSAWRY